MNAAPIIDALQARQDWRNQRLLLMGERARKLNEEARKDPR